MPPPMGDDQSGAAHSLPPDSGVVNDMFGNSQDIDGDDGSPHLDTEQLLGGRHGAAAEGPEKVLGDAKKPGRVRRKLKYILGESREQFLFGCFDEIALVSSWPDRGDPLWTYFSFQQQLTKFWLIVIPIQAIAPVYAFIAGLWGREHKSAFIDSWAPRVNYEGGANGSSNDHAYHALKYTWWGANSLTMLLALLLPQYITRLADWRTALPSFRHLLDSGMVIVKLRGDVPDGQGGVQTMDKNLDKMKKILQDATRELSYQPGDAIITDDYDPEDRNVELQFQDHALDRAQRIKDRFREVVESMEIQTKEDRNYLEDLRMDIAEDDVHCCGREWNPWFVKWLRHRSLQLANIVVFAGLCIGGAVFVRWLTDRKSDHDMEQHGLVEYVIISLSLIVTKVVFEKLSGIIGELSFGTHAEMREAAAFTQRLGFKCILIIVTLYSVRGDEGSCRETAMATTLLVYMCIDYSVGWLVQFLVPTLLNLLKTAPGADETAFDKISAGMLVKMLPQSWAEAEECAPTGLCDLRGQSTSGRRVSVDGGAVPCVGRVLRKVRNSTKLGRSSKSGLYDRLALSRGRSSAALAAGAAVGSPPGSPRDDAVMIRWADHRDGGPPAGVIPRETRETREWWESGGHPAVEPERERMLLHEEYLDIVYNQFVLYLAVPLFPPAAIMGLIFNVIEGRIDHWKIRRKFVGKPEGTAADTQIQVVSTCMTIVIFCAATAPIVGIMGVLTGMQSQKPSSGEWGNCTFP